MRVSRYQMVGAGLLGLPLALWLVNAGFFLSLVSTLVGVFVVWVSQLSKLADTKGKRRIVLESISASHYCEKVRWCLDQAQVEYTEECSAGILGMLFTGRTVPTLRISQIPLRISNSSTILR